MTLHPATTAGHRHRAPRRGRHRIPLHLRSYRPAGILLATFALVAGFVLTTGTSGASLKHSSTFTKFGNTIQPQGGQSFAAALNQADTTFGGLEVYRTFYGGVPPAWPGDAGLGHRPVVVSFNDTPSDVLSGREDTRIQAWFASAPRAYPIYWIYYHEPEDNIARGSFTASQYRAAWVHLRALQRSAGRMDLKSTLNLMCWTLGNSGRNWRNYYPGGSVIDVLAFDCYNWGAHAHQLGYASPQKIFYRAADLAASLGKPFGIAETGSARLASDPSGTGRAAWLRAMAGYLNSRHALFVCYFNVRGSKTDYRLTDGPSQKAWRDIVSA